MDKIVQEAKSLREEIDSLPSVKEYYRLKSLYEADEELAEMRKEIARLKKEGKEEERKNLLAVYQNHPLTISPIKEYVCDSLILTFTIVPTKEMSPLK